MPLKMMLCGDDAAAGRRRLYIKAVCQSVKLPPPPAWIMQPPLTGETLLNGIISPSGERPITMQNNWKEPRSILMSSVDRAAHIDGQPGVIIVSTHALPAEHVQSNKTEQSIYECLLGFCFNNIFCAATNFAASTGFLPNSKTKK